MPNTAHDTAQKTSLDLPATVIEIAAWLDSLPSTATVEATVYNSFRKATGQTKIQRLTVYCD